MGDFTQAKFHYFNKHPDLDGSLALSLVCLLSHLFIGPFTTSESLVRLLPTLR